MNILFEGRRCILGVFQASAHNNANRIRLLCWILLLSMDPLAVANIVSQDCSQTLQRRLPELIRLTVSRLWLLHREISVLFRLRVTQRHLNLRKTRKQTTTSRIDSLPRGLILDFVDFKNPNRPNLLHINRIHIVHSHGKSFHFQG